MVFKKKQTAVDEQIAEIDKLNAVINAAERDMLKLRKVSLLLLWQCYANLCYANSRLTQRQPYTVSSTLCYWILCFLCYCCKNNTGCCVQYDLSV